MHHHTTRRFAASGVLLLAALAGCGGTAEPAAAPPIPSFTPSEVAAAPPSTTVEQAAPPPSSAAGGQVPAPAPVEASPSTDCKAAELTLAAKDGDAAAGTVYRSVVFTNKGSRTCTIHGFPGVSYVTGEDGQQVGPAAYRVGTKGAPINLAPGDSAAADIGFVNVRNYDAAVCKPTEVRGLRVYPPHDTASMFLPLPGLGCAGSPPGNQLTVKTVR
ncbi:DUF4232 domain-containing protein [Actinokineospora sp.]|uniref:DUF4232 domain-containing protein n=1 Tax=Actinokineospora sp. TaxID=1872133 RepID=UPI0040378400